MLIIKAYNTGIPNISEPPSKDPYARLDEYGKPRKNRMDSSPGFGSNDRRDNSNVGMGVDRDDGDYVQGLTSHFNNGEKADDESGPGNNPEPQQMGMINEDFVQLDLFQGDKDDSKRVSDHVKKLLNSEPVSLQTKRQPVDNL